MNKNLPFNAECSQGKRRICTDTEQLHKRYAQTCQSMSIAAGHRCIRSVFCASRAVEALE